MTDPSTTDRAGLASVPLARSRVLALAGGVVFGLATRMALRSTPAHAWHGSPPHGCGPSNRCHNCSGTESTDPNATRRYGHCKKDTPNRYCWSICLDTGGGDRIHYYCCDHWMYDSRGRRQRCICRGRVGTCGPPRAQGEESAGAIQQTYESGDDAVTAEEVRINNAIAEPAVHPYQFIDPDIPIGPGDITDLL